MFNSNQKRLLALDGGGILGVMALCVLKRMEEQLRPLSSKGEEFRLCHFFDCIGGTSTGAIIAAGLPSARPRTSSSLSTVRTDRQYSERRSCRVMAIAQ